MIGFSITDPSGASFNGSSSYPFDFSTASALVEFVCYVSSSTYTLTDTGGNTWSLLGTETVAGLSVDVWVCFGPGLVPGQVVTAAGTGTAAWVGACAVGGVLAFIGFNGATASAVSTLATGSVFPGVGGLAVAGCGLDFGTTAPLPDVLYSGESAAIVGGVTFGGGVAAFVTPGVTECTWSWTGASGCACGIVALS